MTSSVLNNWALTLRTLGRNSNWWYFSYSSQKIGSDMSCKQQFPVKINIHTVFILIDMLEWILNFYLAWIHGYTNSKGPYIRSVQSKEPQFFTSRFYPLHVFLLFFFVVFFYFRQRTKAAAQITDAQSDLGPYWTQSITYQEPLSEELLSRSIWW